MNYQNLYYLANKKNNSNSITAKGVLIRQISMCIKIENEKSTMLLLESISQNVVCVKLIVSNDVTTENSIVTS